MTDKEIAEAHWDWLEPILRMSGCFNNEQLRMVRYLFITALIHGWKHGQEAMNLEC